VSTPLLHPITPNHRPEKKIPSRASHLFLAPSISFSEFGPFLLLLFSIPLSSFFFLYLFNLTPFPQDPRLLVNTVKMAAPNDAEVSSPARLAHCFDI
jgi:hypothetical protein